MPDYQTINIILADDHDLFRDGFRSLIDEIDSINLVAEASDGYSLLNLVEVHRPDVVITDIRMPGLGGVTAAGILAQKYPHLPIIALSMFNEDHLVIDMLAVGAKGYLLKGAAKKTIIEAIETVHRSQSFYCHETSINIARLIATNVYDPIRRERKTLLSKREIDILRLICQEKTNNRIAHELGISLRTVEGFRTKMLAKTNSTTVIGLYRFAINNGLLEEHHSQKQSPGETGFRN